MGVSRPPSLPASSSSSSCRLSGRSGGAPAPAASSAGRNSSACRNFVELPGVVGAWSSIENTLLFALYSVPAILVGALAIALVLARVRRGASIYRFLVYFPVLVPGVVAALIWLFLTNVDFGLFNEVITALRRQAGRLARRRQRAPASWRSSMSGAMSATGPCSSWPRSSDCPRNSTRPRELDGASALARFRYLTLPLLRRIIFFAIVVSTIWGLQVFDTALVLTNGGPGTADHDRHLSRLAICLRLQQQGRLRLGDLAGPDRGDPGADAAPDASASRSPRRRLMAIAAYRRWPRVPESFTPAIRRRQAPARRNSRRHLLLIVVTFILVAPFYYVFLASLKNSTAIFSYPPKPVPIPLYLDNYQQPPRGTRASCAGCSTPCSSRRA